MGVCLGTQKEAADHRRRADREKATRNAASSSEPPPLAPSSVNAAEAQRPLAQEATMVNASSTSAPHPLPVAVNGASTHSATAAQRPTFCHLEVPEPPPPAEILMAVRSAVNTSVASTAAATTHPRPPSLQHAGSSASFLDNGPNSAVQSLSSYGGGGRTVGGGRITLATFSPLCVSPQRALNPTSRVESGCTWDDYGSSRRRSSEAGGDNPLSPALFDPTFGQLAAVHGGGCGSSLASPLRWCSQVPSGYNGGSSHRRQDHLSPPSVFSFLVDNHSRSPVSTTTAITSATERSMTGMMDVAPLAADKHR